MSELPADSFAITRCFPLLGYYKQRPPQGLAQEEYLHPTFPCRSSSEGCCFRVIEVSFAISSGIGLHGSCCHTVDISLAG